MLKRALVLTMVLCGLVAADPKATGKGKLLWRSAVSGLGEGTAAVDGGFVFAPVTNMSAFACLDARTGAMKWRTQLHDTTPFPPVLDKDSVYVITSSCTIYSLSRADGHEQWSRWIAPSIHSMPALCDGKLYAASCDYDDKSKRADGWSVVCLDASSGKELWARTVGADILGAPLVNGSEVYVSTTSGKVSAIETARGGLKWEADVHAASMPVLDGERLVVRTGNGLVSVDRKAGKEALTYSLPAGTSLRSSSPFVFPMVAGGRAYVVLDGSKLACLDLKKSSTNWTWSAGGKMVGEPVVAGGRVYVGASDRALHCIDASSGKPVWKVPTSGNVMSAPTVTEGKIFAYSDAGSMECVDAGTPTATGWGMWGGGTSHDGRTDKEKVEITPSAADGAGK